MKMQKIWLFSSSLMFAACSHGVPPTDLISTTEFSVREVEKPDAMKVAPLEVKEARDQLDKAKNEVGKKNYILARRLTEKSLVNANLAQAKADTEKAKYSAEDAEKGIETLKQETNRQTP